MEALNDIGGQVQEILEGQIDFEGQRLAEKLTTALLGAVGIAAFLAGYLRDDIYATLYGGLIGTGLVFLVIVPAWPFFNKHPLQWLPSKNSNLGVEIVVDGKKVR
ncbi:MAG: hypothetical protein M1824_006546 [Vezdaea acicularis]|nr:MAG: hypothetical protein M1824_006546 [Vezdaea acicularis]